MMRVGLLGTGRMGSAMATSVARAGFPLVLYNRSPASARTLAAELGATVGDSPAAVAADVDVIISMVSDGAAVHALYDGPVGVSAGIRAGAVALEMSTVPPSVVRSLADMLRARGADILDAPVSGSVTLAATGQLSVMAGGDAATLEQARPVLDAMAARVIHVGPLGSGATIKLCVNAIILGLNQSVAESLVLAERAGVDRAVAYDVFAGSAAAAPYVGYKRAAFVTPETTPVAFSVDLAIKDLSLITDLATEVGAAMPQARLDLDELRAVASEMPGGGSGDLSTVAGRLRR